MKKLMLLIVALSLISGCATYDRVFIWGFETFIDDTLKNTPIQESRDE